MASHVQRLHAFPDPKVWSIYLRRTLVALDEHVKACLPSPGHVRTSVTFRPLRAQSSTTVGLQRLPVNMQAHGSAPPCRPLRTDGMTIHPKADDASPTAELPVQICGRAGSHEGGGHPPRAQPAPAGAAPPDRRSPGLAKTARAGGPAAARRSASAGGRSPNVGPTSRDRQTCPGRPLRPHGCPSCSERRAAPLLLRRRILRSAWFPGGAAPTSPGHRWCPWSLC
jgi:hypothetical protein